MSPSHRGRNHGQSWVYAIRLISHRHHLIRSSSPAIQTHRPSLLSHRSHPNCRPSSSSSPSSIIAPHPCLVSPLNKLKKPPRTLPLPRSFAPIDRSSSAQNHPTRRTLSSFAAASKRDSVGVAKSSVYQPVCSIVLPRPTTSFCLALLAWRNLACPSTPPSPNRSPRQIRGGSPC